jgi:DNA-binding PadR family transcriptional regulator
VTTKRKRPPRPVLTAAGLAMLEALHATGRYPDKRGGVRKVLDKLVQGGFLAYEQAGPTSMRYVLTDNGRAALGLKPQPAEANGDE